MTCKNRLRRDQIESGSCCCDSTAIKLGGGKAVEEAAEAIVAILETEAEQETKRKALDTLATMCSIRNVAITGNCITMGKCRCRSGSGE